MSPNFFSEPELASGQYPVPEILGLQSDPEASITIHGTYFVPDKTDYDFNPRRLLNTSGSLAGSIETVSGSGQVNACISIPGMFARGLTRVRGEEPTVKVDFTITRDLPQSQNF